WNVDCGVRLRFPIYGVLIDHPEGLLVFDTGYGLEHVRKVFAVEEPEQWEQETVANQIRLCGYQPENVKYVVNSHLHFDHAGGNRCFPHATTLVHKQELRQAKVPEPFESYAYSDQTFDHLEVRYELLEGDTEIASGLWLFETPGHTVGHYSLLIQMTGRRPMLFTADAAYCMESLERGIISGFHHTPVDAVRSIKRLHATAAKHDAEFFVPHDMQAFVDYRKAPHGYEG
ncbi:MAG: N-acyl homoserine lactonase family protein, partial [Chloroflexota bacterium]